MSVTSVECIYENDGILRDAMDKVISSLSIRKKGIIFVNISYHENKNLAALYSGMKYIAILRGEQEDESPVLFYGFESLQSLKKKSDGSILSSPAVEYIQIPFKLSELRRKIKKVTGEKIIEEPLDEKTARSLALEMISGFKHDLRNVAILLNQHIQGLKAKENKRKREKWNTLAEFGDDFITKRAQRYDKVKDVVEGSFPKNSGIRQVPGILTKAEDGYKSLKSIIKSGNYAEGKLPQIIRRGESVVGLVRKVETILEKVQHGG